MKLLIGGGVSQPSGATLAPGSGSSGAGGLGQACFQPEEPKRAWAELESENWNFGGGSLLSPLFPSQSAQVHRLELIGPALKAYWGHVPHQCPE